MDLSPAFANPTTGVTGNTPGGQRLARQLGSAFAAFAKTGSPNNPAIPAWNAYDPLQRSVMLFNETTQQVNDPDREIRQMWDNILAV
jgi:para-nitrobenzyl esterase